MALEEPGYVGALLLGLFGSIHCVGMCGGIAGALGQALPQRGGLVSIAHHVGYSLGRISSYCLAGALTGAAGHAVGSAMGGPGMRGLRVLCGLMLIAVGAYLAGWWSGVSRLESLGARLWRHISPLSARLQPVDRPWKIWATGAVWGWLPCGLVYGALATSAAAGSAARGALFMACFGLGTLPAVVATGAFSSGLARFTRRRETRWIAGTLVIAFGVWTIVGASGMGHSGHDAANAPDHSQHHHHTIDPD